jgi:hypothetical protein
MLDPCYRSKIVKALRGSGHSQVMQQKFRWGWFGTGRALARLCGLLPLLTGCGEGPFLQTEEYTTAAGQAERYRGGGCMSVQEGNGMESGVAGQGSGSNVPWTPRVLYSYTGTGDGVHFSVSDEAGTLLVDRDYTSDFLLSGETDIVVIELEGGSMRFTHWGGEECGEIREPDSEPTG